MGNEKGEAVPVIRLAAGEDFAAAVACLSAVRGARYYEAKLYEPAYLAATMVVLVAEMNGSVVATMSLTRSFFAKERSLLSHLAVRSEFSGLGLASLLIQAGLTHLRGANVAALKAHVVTSSVIVQQLVEKQEFVPTGFLFGVRDNAKVLSGEGFRAAKRSLVIYVKRAAKQNVGQVFVHQALRHLAAKVYDSLHVRYTLQIEGVLSGTSVINHFQDQHHSVFYLQIQVCGADLTDKILDFIRRSNEDSLWTITLLLNINDSASIPGFEVLQRLGFRFAGFDPLGEDCEQIVMFYQNKAALQGEEILTTERASAILTEVLHVDEVCHVE